MKKNTFIIFMLLLCFTAQTAAVAEGLTHHARDLTPNLRILNAQEGGNAYLLLDGDSSTGAIVDNGKTLVIESDEAVSQLYLVWDTPHAAWDLLLPDSGKITCGREGFIHEYIKLDSPLNSITIAFKGTEEILCDIYAFGEGEPPEWVQRWQPPHEDADMLMFPVNAGEELAFYGGTIPFYAGELGLKLQVAYMTNLWEDAPRTHELLNGLYEAGLRNYPVISEFPSVYAATADGARQVYDEDALIGFETEQIRRFKPEVVLGSSIGGEYGNGVNTLCAETLLAAVEISGDELEFRDSARKYGVWEPLKTYLHLYPENRVEMNWDIALEKFNGETALEMAKKGFDAGVPWNENFRLEASGPYDCRKFGLAHSIVGTDVQGGDFFENTPLGDVSESIVSANRPLPPEADIMPAAETRDGFKTLTWIGGAAVFCLIAAVVLRFFKD